MDLLLILTYVAFCYAVFKIFKIPVTQWSLATAALGGIVGIALLLLVMNYNHPFSTNARIYFAVTPILPAVKGRVVEVPAAETANTQLKAGDVLFKLDRAPYEHAVTQKRALLAEAESGVAQLKAALNQAAAAAERTKAQLALAQQTYDRQAELFQRNVVAQASIETATRNLESAKQTVVEGEAVRERAELAYGSMIDGVHTTLARLRAELADAEYELEQTIIRAPTDGFVTQVALRPGMYVVPAPLRPAMIFVHGTAKDRVLAAAFQQNSLQRVRTDDEAEIAFDAVPGRVFKGKVKLVLDAIAAGQLQAGGTLQDLGERLPGGRAVAVIDILDDVSGYQIPLGAAAEVAIYTHHFHHVSVMRKILLRMRSWQNYIYMEAH